VQAIVQSPALIIPTTRERMPEWLVCRLRVVSGTTVERLRASAELAQMREKFVHAMRLQGWDFTGIWAKEIRGPKPWIGPSPTPLPDRPTPRVYGYREPRDTHRPTVEAGNWAITVPSLGESEHWAYRFAGLFQRPREMVEILDDANLYQRMRA
jgi:hypothetical protein